jgi:hypothetical protein
VWYLPIKYADLRHNITCTVRVGVLVIDFDCPLLIVL